MTEPPPCPACGRPFPKPKTAAPTSSERWPAFPFCSQRCRLLDLNEWLTGRYVIPGPPVDPDDEV